MVCFECGKPAAGVCTRCQKGYCKEHSDGLGGGLCWQCRVETETQSAGYRGCCLGILLVPVAVLIANMFFYEIIRRPSLFLLLITVAVAIFTPPVFFYRRARQSARQRLAAAKKVTQEMSHRKETLL